MEYDRGGDAGDVELGVDAARREGLEDGREGMVAELVLRLDLLQGNYEDGTRLVERWEGDRGDSASRGGVWEDDDGSEEPSYGGTEGARTRRVRLNADRRIGKGGSKARLGSGRGREEGEVGGRGKKASGSGALLKHTRGMRE